ncbi:hypothetical protein [Rubripirellula tenax]|uniref:hypothetical protein n=1 Tax=Rubripirellula tenax TaxID=2528015 RepID=UPI0011B573A3|nr:hypothetical protein [Rubripirellula tenax]
MLPPIDAVMKNEASHASGKAGHFISASYCLSLFFFAFSFSLPAGSSSLLHRGSAGDAINPAVPGGKLAPELAND